MLIFEEVKSPRTGKAADIDLAHRHPVLLTKVTQDKDQLTDQPVVEIEWAAADALPFPMCLSTTGSAPDCEKLENVTIARGNVVLVDHGRTIGRHVVDDQDDEDLGTVPVDESLAECGNTSCAAEVTIVPGRFRPSLKQDPLTFSEPLPSFESLVTGATEELDESPCPRQEISAASLLRQDPRQALPQITLTTQVPGDDTTLTWQPRYDLFGSLADDLHYVVEMTIVRARVCDSVMVEMGRAPIAGEHFRARYRAGNGLAGNVGAEAISHIVLKNTHSGIEFFHAIRSRPPAAPKPKGWTRSGSLHLMPFATAFNARSPPKITACWHSAIRSK